MNYCPHKNFEEDGMRKNFLAFIGLLAVFTLAFGFLACPNDSTDNTKPPVKTVSVGPQSGTLNAGTAGAVTFPVTTTNILNGTYTATVENRPAGVSVSGQVTINNNSGTLTLAGNATTVQGVTGTLTLKIADTTSAAFTLTISAAIPADPTAAFTISFEDDEDMALTTGEDAGMATFTVTGAGNYSGFKWLLDGDRQEDFDDEAEFTLSKSDAGTGLHRITVVAYKDDTPYSQEFKFRFAN